MSMSSAGMASQPSKPRASWFTTASFSWKVNFMFGRSISRSAFRSTFARRRYFTPSYTTVVLSACVVVLRVKRSWVKSPSPRWSSPARSMRIGSVASSYTR